MRINDVYIKKLRVPVYRTSLWIVISENIIRSIDAVEDLIDKVIAEPSAKKSLEAYTYGYEDHDGKMRIIVFVKPSASPGLIAHEANHALNIILSWNGVKPSFSNDETESSYLEFIVNRIHKEKQLYLTNEILLT